MPLERGQPPSRTVSSFPEARQHLQAVFEEEQLRAGSDQGGCLLHREEHQGERTGRGKSRDRVDQNQRSQE